jgi:hypothetical protein
MPIIPAMWEEFVGGSRSKASLGKNMRLSKKITSKKGWGYGSE